MLKAEKVTSVFSECHYQMIIGRSEWNCQVGWHRVQ